MATIHWVVESEGRMWTARPLNRAEKQMWVVLAVDGRLGAPYFEVHQIDLNDSSVHLAGTTATFGAAQALVHAEANDAAEGGKSTTPSPRPAGPIEELRVSETDTTESPVPLGAAAPGAPGSRDMFEAEMAQAAGGSTAWYKMIEALQRHTDGNDQVNWSDVWDMYIASMMLLSPENFRLAFVHDLGDLSTCAWCQNKTVDPIYAEMSDPADLGRTPLLAYHRECLGEYEKELKAGV